MLCEPSPSGLVLQADCTICDALTVITQPDGYCSTIFIVGKLPLQPNSVLLAHPQAFRLWWLNWLDEAINRDWCWAFVEGWNSWCSCSCWRRIWWSQILRNGYFPSPSNQGMIPGSLIWGEMGKGVEKCGSAATSVQSLTDDQYGPIVQDLKCSPNPRLFYILMSAEYRRSPIWRPRSGRDLGSQLEDQHPPKIPSSADLVMRGSFDGGFHGAILRRRLRRWGIAPWRSADCWYCG